MVWLLGLVLYPAIVAIGFPAATSDFRTRFIATIAFLNHDGLGRLGKRK